jgi:hypothetical protein
MHFLDWGLIKEIHNLCSVPARGLKHADVLAASGPGIQKNLMSDLQRGML